MTREELERVADAEVTIAGATLQLMGTFPPRFAVHFPHAWQAFTMPDDTKHLMNIGKAKDHIFGFFRNLVNSKSADAVVFCTDGWFSSGRAATREAAIADAASTRCEAIMLTAQTATDVLLIVQPYGRAGGDIDLVVPGVRREWLLQQNFGGRQKMFGDLREQNLS